jgi:hypothetical protein
VVVNTIMIRHYNGGADLTVLCDLDQRRRGRFRRADHTAADAGDSAEDPIPMAIETSHGLLVACLGATGQRVYAINPMA